MFSPESGRAALLANRDRDTKNKRKPKLPFVGFSNCQMREIQIYFSEIVAAGVE